MASTPLRVTIAHDWLVRYAGSERCVAEMLAAFPGSRLITSLLDPSELPSAFAHGEPSALQRVPGALEHHEWLLPLMPLAWRLRRPVSGVDALVSSSHACAKAMRSASVVPHLCYCHTPMRYAWDFDAEKERFPRASRPAARLLMWQFRRWDRTTSDRVTTFVANSRAVAARIRDSYGRTAQVIHPPVDTAFFTPGGERSGRFLYVGRLVGYKRARLVVEAFRDTPFELTVIGDGRDARALEATLPPNVTLIRQVTAEALREHMRSATALVYPADEDFGITMAEAQACGTPVIGLRTGGHWTSSATARAAGWWTPRPCPRFGARFAWRRLTNWTPAGSAQEHRDSRRSVTAARSAAPSRRWSSRSADRPDPRPSAPAGSRVAALVAECPCPALEVPTTRIRRGMAHCGWPAGDSDSPCRGHEAREPGGYGQEATARVAPSPEMAACGRRGEPVGRGATHAGHSDRDGCAQGGDGDARREALGISVPEMRDPLPEARPPATPPHRERRLLPALARRWYVLLAIPIVLAAAVFVIEAGKEDRYESTARILLQPTDLGAAIAGVPDLGNVDPERAIATEAEIASVPEVRTRAEKELGVSGSSLADGATISFDAARSFTGGDSDVFTVTVVAGDPTFSRQMASAVARHYIRFRTEVATGEITAARDQARARIAEIRDGGNGSPAELDNLLRRAETLDTLLLLSGGKARLLAEGDAADQVAPEPVRRAAIAGILGIVLGAVLILVAERFDKRIRFEDEVSAHLGAPVIGRLPDPRRLGARGTVIALAEPNAGETESIRMLRANLRFSLLGREGHSAAVTSAEEGEGKSFVSGNLAVAAAAAGARVGLVDLDLRRPSLHRYLGVERTPGVTDVLTGSTSLDDALVSIDIRSGFTVSSDSGGSLHLLSAGTPAPNPGEVVASMALRGLLRDLEDRFELIIVDTPPTLAVSDALPVTSSVSGTIAVVHLPGATKTSLDALRQSLEPSGGTMAIVLTAAWRASSGYASYTRQSSVHAES